MWFKKKKKRTVWLVHSDGEIKRHTAIKTSNGMWATLVWPYSEVWCLLLPNGKIIGPRYITSWYPDKGWESDITQTSTPQAKTIQ